MIASNDLKVEDNHRDSKYWERLAIFGSLRGSHAQILRAYDNETESYVVVKMVTSPKLKLM